MLELDHWCLQISTVSLFYIISIYGHTPSEVFWNERCRRQFSVFRMHRLLKVFVLPASSIPQTGLKSCRSQFIWHLTFANDCANAKAYKARVKMMAKSFIFVNLILLRLTMNPLIQQKVMQQNLASPQIAVLYTGIYGIYGM